MNNSGKLVLALLLFAGSGVWLFYYYRSQPAPGETVMHRAPVACEGCGKAYDGEIGDQPGVCHFCRERKLWKAHKCLQCKSVVPIVQTPGGDGGVVYSRVCPKCGGKRFGEVQVEDVSPP